MALSIRFPLYGSSLVTGPYNVSLSFPGQDSFISSSVGLEDKTALLVPNIGYIRKFVEGNLGISDGMFGESMFKNLSNPISAKNDNVFSSFTQNTGVDVGDVNKLKDKDGRIKIKSDDIKFELPSDVGLKMLETLVMKSIFETQKPYMDLASIIIDLVGDIEDVIARTAPLASVTPPSTKSKRPSVNDKDENGPRAIGFKGGNIKEKLQELKNLTSGGTGSDENGNIVKNGNVDENSTSGNQGSSNSDKYKILSTVYSTGQFNPSIDYKYVYIDLPPEVNDKPKLETPPVEENNFEKYKPKTLVFGIFDKDGVPINPSEKLTVKDNSGTETKTPYSKASWITQTDKWKLGNNNTIWPSFAQPFYVWEKGSKKIISDTQPDGYSIKKYKKGDKNIISKENAIEGNPVISRFGNVDNDEYLDYYVDILSYGLHQSGLPKEEQVSIRTEILKNLDIRAQLENTFLYGQLSETSIYKSDKNFPDLMRKIFKPFKIHSTEAEADEKLRSFAESKGETPGMIWINPETDYKLKVIKVTPSSVKPEEVDEILINGVPSGILDPSKLTNQSLQKNGRFSNGKYGHGSEEEPQEVDTVSRFMSTETDTDVYYIIEGVLMEEDGEDTEKTDPNANQNKSDSNKWYRLPHAVGVFKVFVNILVKIFSKLVPAASQLISLFGSPASFVTDIIISKLGEFFGPLSPDSTRKLKTSLNTSANQFNSKGEFLKAKKRPIKESKLNNFVFVGDDGGLTTIIDGTALIPFVIFGKDLSFGLDLKMGEIIKRPPVKLIFPDINIKSLKDNLQSLKPPFKDKTNRNELIPSLSNGGLSSEEAFRKTDTSYPFDTQPNNLRDSVSIKYSTGEYIPGVNYNYIYINEDVQNLLKEVDELVKKGDDESIVKSNLLINKALELDPENKYIQNKKKDLKGLLDKIGANTQPLLKLVLGIVTTPIKIIAGIVEYILDFFKSLSNPFTLPNKMTEFLSFKWIVDFFTPKFLLDMIGIKFDPLKISDWISKAFAKKDDGAWLLDGSVEIDDISEIINIAFIKPPPIYTVGMLRANPNIFSLILKPILCFIEKIINSIIKFIWAVLGIEAIIKVPQIKLCDDNLSPEELSELINNDNVDDLLNPDENTQNGINGNGDTKLDQFVYEIKLPNGEIVRKPNLEELNKFIQENEGFNFEKNF